MQRYHFFEFVMPLTLQGNLYQDMMSVNGLSTQAYVGDLTSSQGVSTNENDGILGLGYASLSDGVPTFMDKLVKTRGVPDVFSMCFGAQDGILVVGETDPTYYTGPFQWTPF